MTTFEVIKAVRAAYDKSDKEDFWVYVPVELAHRFAAAAYCWPGSNGDPEQRRFMRSGLPLRIERAERLLAGQVARALTR